jgi:hypothetical protein
MDHLLDQADALVLTAGVNLEPSRPNFDIPEEYHAYTAPYELLELLENSSKGKGWFAKRDFPAGSLLMVSKPIAMALDWEWSANGSGEGGADMEEDGGDDSENASEPEESQINELLLLQVLRDIKVNPSLWTDVVSSLYPRDAVDVQASPVWISKDDALFMQFEALIQELDQIPQLHGATKEILQRLPLIIRYNVLSVETCPELLSYPGLSGHSCLAGVGLYHLPSFFNHDARPNVSRYAVGDVMWFVANQNIPVGREVCISYLEHDVLCESTYRRNLMLTLDFQEDENADPQGFGEDQGPQFPVVDIDVQNELMKMEPYERLESIEQLMRQALGEALPEAEQVEAEEDGMDTAGGAWYQCDVQNCRILKAITLDGVGQSQQALAVWEECVVFTETKLPPLDESSIVMRVQAALCAWKVKDKVRAEQHASVALTVHNRLFGGGSTRFLRRYRNEFRLSLRSEEKDAMGRSPDKILWPLQP